MYATNLSMDEAQLIYEFRKNENFEYLKRYELELDLEIFKLTSFDEMNKFEKFEINKIRNLSNNSDWFDWLIEINDTKLSKLNIRVVSYGSKKLLKRTKKY